jgi:hypothetical protein
VWLIIDVFPSISGFFLREDVLAAMMAEVQQHVSNIARLEAEVTQSKSKLDDERKFFEQQVLYSDNYVA